MYNLNSEGVQRSKVRGINMNKNEKSCFLPKQNPRGHTVSEYLERISGDIDNGENNGDGRKAFYSALFYLNQEIEEEIKSRKKELILLKRVKGTIVKGLVPFNAEAAEQFDELIQKNSGSDFMEKTVNFEIQVDLETAKKLTFIAKEKGKSTEQYLIDLLKTRLKDVK